MSYTAAAPPPGPPPSGGAFDDAEPPPAYAPTPASHLGESTVELGPRRPFTSAPGVRFQPVSAQVTGAGDVQYVAPAPAAHTGGHFGPGSSSPPGVGRHYASPPPRHPSLTDASWHGVVDISPTRSRTVNNSRPTPALPPRPQERPMSDFAADFYAAGAGDVDSAVNTNSSPRARSASPASPDSINMAEFAPPPGPPPASVGRSATTVRPGHARGSSAGGVPDDGRPTSTPVPGHPLLLAGQLLVYPAGYNCPKCSNTGYKHADPSHPCRRCWRAFAQPYTGAITYAPTDASVPSLSGKTFQRPLPNLRPPQQPAPSSAGSSFGEYPGSLGRMRTVHTSRFEPAWGPSFPPRGPHIQAWTGYGAPPRGAVVVMPGDRRIGGRPCWRCDGEGTVSFLLFDREPCPVCNGLGRVF